MVQVTIGGGSQFKSSETDIVQGFVINDHTFIGVFNQLMDRQSGVVRFNNGIRYFRRGNNGESFHNSIGVFFSNFGDQKSSHTRSGTTTQGVSDLETLKAITTFSFFSNDVQNGIDKFSTFSVMSLSPIVTGTSLTENEVIGSEKLTERTGSNGVHGSGFQIHKDGSGNVSSSSSFVIVHIDSF
jgi:hypothetical protein